MATSQTNPMQKISELFPNLPKTLNARKLAYLKHTKRMPNNEKLQPLKQTAGATYIQNNLLDAIITDPELTKRELKILFLILRLTTGLHATTCALNNRDFESCGIKENHTKDTIKTLVQKNWISTHKNHGNTSTYQISREKHCYAHKDPKLGLLIAHALYTKDMK